MLSQKSISYLVNIFADIIWKLIIHHHVGHLCLDFGLCLKYFEFTLFSDINYDHICRCHIVENSALTVFCCHYTRAYHEKMSIHKLIQQQTFPIIKIRFNSKCTKQISTKTRIHIHQFTITKFMLHGDNFFTIFVYVESIFYVLCYSDLCQSLCHSFHLWSLLIQGFINWHRIHHVCIISCCINTRA